MLLYEGCEFTEARVTTRSNILNVIIAFLSIYICLVRGFFKWDSWRMQLPFLRDCFATLRHA